MAEKILISYDYFYPAYKAGGPIRSLSNLARLLCPDLDIHVICSTHDLGQTAPLDGIKTGQWNSVLLPDTTAPVKVWYLQPGWTGIREIRHILKKENFSAVYLNGMFSPRFLMLPLWIMDKRKQRTIVSPRGMLQQGALSVRAGRKKIYLTVARWLGLFRGVTWHATNESEANDIRRQFGKEVPIVVAQNVPQPPFSKTTPSAKKEGRLDLIYLSLITEKKNLLALIQAVKEGDAGISLRIYGPVKDAAYWEKCKAVIHDSGERIRYCGDVPPGDVQPLLAGADLLALPTKGENFGHALYESLGVGRPVLTSYFTPWNELETKKAGWNIDINEPAALKTALEKIRQLATREHQEFCDGAHRLACDYFFSNPFKKDYLQLFLPDYEN